MPKALSKSKTRTPVKSAAASRQVVAKRAKAAPPPKRAYVKQTDVPLTSLEFALRVPQAILDHYGGKPTTPMQLAKALQMDPKGSQIRVLSGSAIAFGLTEGGAQSPSISVTPLARRIVRPKAEGDDLVAKREAVLLPRVFRDFLTQYDGHPFPRKDIALNILEDIGVPRAKADDVLERIESSAKYVGFLDQIKDKTYVTLQGVTPAATEDAETYDFVATQPEGGAPEEDQIPEAPPEPVARAQIFPPAPRATEPQGAALNAAIADAACS